MSHPNDIAIERHPLEPFTPADARILMLGSFPPPTTRWSMEFFYPNFQNDMWRICGVLFYGNKRHFEASGERRFDKERVVEFCTRQGIALYDTACAVRRLRGNASDAHLEVIEPTDIAALLGRMPLCKTIVTTGEKATDTLCATMQCPKPEIGGYVDCHYADRPIRFWRMPSSSRAYPLRLEAKAERYAPMFGIDYTAPAK